MLAKGADLATQKSPPDLLRIGRAFLYARGSVRRSRVLLNRTLLLGTVLLARNRLEVDLYTAVLRTTIDIAVAGNRAIRAGTASAQVGTCLLYTSDAADE